MNYRTINEPTKMDNEFNDHFTTIAQIIEQKLIKPKFNYFKYLRNTNEQSVFINPRNAEEVLSEIKNLNYNKSTGPCGILLKFHKYFKKY